MDCDVAPAFDHVSHHEIIKATLTMGVPPVLIDAWIREYRNSETIVALDDVVTLGMSCTKSVPQGDPCAADLFGAALDTPAAMFCDGDCLWETGIICHQASFKLWQERGMSCWNRLDCKLIGEKRCGARRHRTVWQQASLCRKQ